MGSYQVCNDVMVAFNMLSNTHNLQRHNEIRENQFSLLNYYIYVFENI